MFIIIVLCPPYYLICFFTISDCTTPFYKSYSQHQKVVLNWRDGKYQLTDFMRQEQTVTAMDICEDLLATGSSEKVIKVWKISQQRCTMQLEGHQVQFFIVGLSFFFCLALRSCM